MENLKIKVSSEAESKEVQELFFELGYGWHGKGKLVSYLDKILSNDFGWLVLWKPSYLTNTVIQMGSGFEDCKEITLQELRDMVVLKRNDVVDATHSVDGLNGSAINLSGKWYAFNFNIREWELWTDCFEYRLDDLKPIKEEVMKESLNDKIATAEVARQEEKHSHYKKDVSRLNVIDVYRVLELYSVESHAVGHAIKKLLCCGQRGAKGRKQDIQEAIDSLNRELEMVTEDEL